MTGYAAFLRGVNLGKRTVRSADLRAAFEAMGYADAKTLIASGNVVFSAKEDETALTQKLEKGLHEAFGFQIGVVLRSKAQLQAMVDAAPFAKVPDGADAKFYALLLREPNGEAIELPHGVPGDYDVTARTQTDIFAVAWKMANGRYGEGLDNIEEELPKGTLVTSRNWNTINRALAAMPEGGT